MPSFTVSGKKLKLLLSTYKLLQKLKIHSPLLEFFTEFESGVDDINNTLVHTDYKFKYSDITVFKIYSHEDSSTILDGLRKLSSAKNVRGNTFLNSLTKQNINKLGADFYKVRGGSSSRNFGPIWLEKSPIGDVADMLTLSVQSIENQLAVVHAKFHLTDASRSALEEMNSKSISPYPKITFYFNLFTNGKFVTANASIGNFFDDKRSALLDNHINRVNGYLKKYIKGKSEDVFGLLTFYNTKRKLSDINDDFLRMSSGHPAWERKSDRIYLNNTGKHDLVEFYLRLGSKDFNAVKPGEPSYPYPFELIFTPFFLFSGIDKYMSSIKSEAYKIVQSTNGWTPLFRISKAYSTLSVYRYKIANLVNMQKNGDWKHFMSFHEYRYGVVNKFDKWGGQKASLSHEFEALFEAKAASVISYLKNAADQINTELSIRSNKSSRKINFALLLLTIVTVVIATTTIFITLYPKTTRQVLCGKVSEFCFIEEDGEVNK